VGPNQTATVGPDQVAKSIHHPVVNLQVRSDGTTNLPCRPPTDCLRNIFDLGIQRLLLTNGEIYYNDVKTPLGVELHDLQLEMKSEFASHRYGGTLSYRDGCLQYCNLKLWHMTCARASKPVPLSSR